MTRRILCFIVLICTATGCAAPNRPGPEFPSGTRVGIINMLESVATHEHYSSARIDSFTKTVAVDWDIPGFMQTLLADSLNADGRYVLLPIAATHSLSGFKTDLRGTDLESERTASELSAQIGVLAAEHQADVVIVITSFKGPSPHKISGHPINLQGYGIFTRWMMPVLTSILPNKFAYSYAQIAVYVYQTRPAATLIGSGMPSPKKDPIKNFDWPVDIKHLSMAHFNLIRPEIQTYAEQAVASALQESNLIPAGVNRRK